MSNIEISSLKDNYFYIGFTGYTDPIDTYSFRLPTAGTTRISAEGFSGNINMELRDKEGRVTKSISTSGIKAGTLSVDNFSAADYILNVSPVSGNTNYQVSLTPDGKVDPLTGMEVDSGSFTPAQSGKVSFDVLHEDLQFGEKDFNNGHHQSVKTFATTPGNTTVVKHFTVKKAITSPVNQRFLSGRGSNGIRVWWPGR